MAAIVETDIPLFFFFPLPLALPVARQGPFPEKRSDTFSWEERFQGPVGIEVANWHACGCDVPTPRSGAGWLAGWLAGCQGRVQRRVEVAAAG